MNKPDHKRHLGNLDEYLDSMPLEQPSEDFVEQVMRYTAANQEGEDATANVVESQRLSWKNPFIHAMAAATGTFLFITSGLFHAITYLNAVEFGSSIQLKVSSAIIYGSEWIYNAAEQISKVLSS